MKQLFSKEYVRQLSYKTGYSQKSIKVILKAMQEVATENCTERSVKLFDGLIIGAKYVEEHQARDPRTGDTIIIPGKYKPFAKFTDSFKNSINS